MFPFIVTVIGNTYLITVNVADAFVFAALVAVLFGVGVPWLAHLEQPKPDPAMWEWISSRRNWKQTVL